MNVLLVDDEPLLLRRLSRAVTEALPSATQNAFGDGDEAIAYAKENKVDIAFLDIRLRGMTGLELAKELVSFNEKTNIVFCTGFSEYALEAFDAYCSAYLTKPINAEKVLKAIGQLRHPVVEQRVKIHCFGNFEAFCDDKPIEFQFNRTKEFLAYLVDRDGMDCTTQEILVSAFDEEISRAYYNQLRADLLQTFTSLGIEDRLRVSRGALAVEREKVACDYFDYKDGKSTQAPTEYMTQYLFAATTREEICCGQPLLPPPEKYKAEFTKEEVTEE